MRSVEVGPHNPIPFRPVYFAPALVEGNAPSRYREEGFDLGAVEVGSQNPIQPPPVYLALALVDEEVVYTPYSGDDGFDLGSVEVGPQNSTIPPV